MPFWDIPFWNNTILDYVIFAASLIVSVGLLVLIRIFVIKRLMSWAKKTPTALDDLLVKTTRRYLMPLLFVGAFYFNTKWLTLPDTVVRVISIICLALVTIFGAFVISTLLIFLFNKYLEKKEKVANPLAIKWMGTLIKIIIWVVALLLFLDNLGVQITSLVAGLGIGGIAIAFAAQAVLEDVFSFVTIFFDKPFELGDFIIVDDLPGTVEHIGVKTTRVRSLSGEQLVFSNRDLTSSRIHNYKRMDSRRIQFSIGVTYDTTAQTLKEIPGIVQRIIENTEGVTFDRVHFKTFGDFSLNFEVVYFVLSQDYAVYMNVQQQINLNIKEDFDRRGIAFAFPSQTIFLEK